MKILIINHYIGSSHYGMDYRQYYLAREWVKQGHEVSVLGASYSHLRIQQPEVAKDLDTEIVDGIKYLWLKTPKYKSSGIKRILNILTFVFKTFRYRSNIAKVMAPDMVLVASTYVLDVYPAYLIAKKHRSRLVYELHDLWPLSPMVIGGYSKHHPFIGMVQRAEDFACKRCDNFISVLSNAKEYLIDHGMKEKKFIYVPNGFSEEYQNSKRDVLPTAHEALLTKLKNEARVIVGYAGGHAPSNALNSFVAAGIIHSRNSKLAFVLVGDGSQKEDLMRLANTNKEENTYFLPAVSKKAIPSFLDYCDILYAGGISSVLHQYGTAFNKIIDYMLAGKPIIFAVDEPNCLVERVGCGLRVEAENVNQIADAIEDLSQMSYKKRNNLGRKGQVYATNELSYSSIAQKILTDLKIN